MRVIFLNFKNCIKAILILIMSGSIFVAVLQVTDNRIHQPLELEQEAHSIGPELPESQHVHVPVFKVPVTGNSNRQLFQVAPQISLSEENRDDVMHELTNRFWTLKSSNNSNSNQQKHQNFFTRSRLKQLARYNLWKPIMPPGTTNQNLKPTIYGNDDRILAQLVFGMEGLDDQASSSSIKTKTILLLNGLKFWNKQPGNLDGECPNYKLNNCRILEDGDDDRFKDADLLISTPNYFSLRTSHEFRAKNGLPAEFKILYNSLESPYQESGRIPPNSSRNDWWSSYWRGSDLTASEKWVYYDTRSTRKIQDINYAESKSKLVAIFVSNCDPYNGRLELVQLLQKFITVDVYGSCGTLQCGRVGEKDCFDILRKQYKFYLAFENANCREYITEKFFVNALRNDIVPVVFGARPEDYKAVAPFNSYIHVEDYNSIADLAQYLLHLDSNEQLYNQYFEWKGTGEFIDTKFFCRVCAMLHYNDLVQPPPNNLEEFNWNPETFCLPPEAPYWNKSKIVEFHGSRVVGLNGLSKQSLGILEIKAVYISMIDDLFNFIVRVFIVSLFVCLNITIAGIGIAVYRRRRSVVINN